jgi:hypothetical protein
MVNARLAQGKVVTRSQTGSSGEQYLLVAHFCFVGFYQIQDVYKLIMMHLD